MLVGERLDLHDPILRTIMDAIDNHVRQKGVPFILLRKLGPWAVEWFDPQYRTAKELYQKLSKIVQPHLEDHLARAASSDYDESDYIFEYLKEIIKFTNCDLFVQCLQT